MHHNLGSTTAVPRIEGYCFTNLDKWKKAEWPRYFVAVPLVGSNVQGCQGEFRPVLHVVAVTHCWDPKTERPFIRVELHN